MLTKLDEYWNPFSDNLYARTTCKTQILHKECNSHVLEILDDHATLYPQRTKCFLKQW